MTRGHPRKAAAVPGEVPTVSDGTEPAVTSTVTVLPAGTAVTEDAAPAPAPAGDLRSRLTALLALPKTKSSLPTFVTYPTGISVLHRHVVVDVDGERLRAAWTLYKAEVPGANAEQFLILVYSILDCEVPRAYRAVSEVTLD